MIDGRPVIFGEVLFDRFPDGSVVMGGAPLNVAWHLQAFGARPLLVTCVGDDELGRKARGSLAARGLDTAGVQVDPQRPTGTVDVHLQRGEPRFDIVGDTAYDAIAAEGVPPLDDAALLYHGSLALREARSRATFDRLAGHLGVPRFLDVNLRAPWWQREQVVERLAGAAWVKLNEHELSELGSGSSDAARELLVTHGLRMLIVTRGERGAEVLLPDESLHVEPETRAEVVDSVGAGDAFSSVLLLGLLSGWPLARTVTRAQEFASALLGVRGAIVEDDTFYAGFRDRWRV